MTKMNAEAARYDSLRVNFTIIMWALLFFMPLPIPGLGPSADVLAWGLLLIGVGATVRQVAGLGLLWGTAAAGMALWIVRALVGWPEAEGARLVAVGLYAASWALVTMFAVQLASLVRRLAVEMGADDLANTVSWRGVLPVVPLVMFAAVPFVPKNATFLFGCASLVVTACILSLVMGVPAGAARMFTRAAKQSAEGDTGAAGS